MINKTTYQTLINGDKIQVRANWAEASCQVEAGLNGDFTTTGHQVADFRHYWSDALRNELTNYLAYDEDSEDIIEESISRAKEV